jgi:hypothetical protein
MGNGALIDFGKAACDEVDAALSKAHLSWRQDPSRISLQLYDPTVVAEVVANRLSQLDAGDFMDVSLLPSHHAAVGGEMRGTQASSAVVVFAPLVQLIAQHRGVVDGASDVRIIRFVFRVTVDAVVRARILFHGGWYHAAMFLRDAMTLLDVCGGDEAIAIAPEIVRLNWKAVGAMTNVVLDMMAENMEEHISIRSQTTLSLSEAQQDIHKGLHWFLVFVWEPALVVLESWPHADRCTDVMSEFSRSILTSTVSMFLARLRSISHAVEKQFRRDQHIEFMKFTVHAANQLERYIHSDVQSSQRLTSDLTREVLTTIASVR